MVPILIGPQGILKSTAVRDLAPLPEFFVTMKFDDKDDMNARLMRGRLVVELPELSGPHTRELEAIKAFITPHA
jgi:predicted P-loop ATPase